MMRCDREDRYRESSSLSSHYTPEEAEMIRRLYADGDFIEKSAKLAKS